MEVSLWLQDKAGRLDLDGLPTEAVMAHRADRFLVEVNQGGFQGFFEWEWDAIPSTLVALSTMGLRDIADLLELAIQIFTHGEWPRDREQLDATKAAYRADQVRMAAMSAFDKRAFAASARIEAATHAYVRANLAAFQKIDGI
jgi:hypothetical protein